MPQNFFEFYKIPLEFHPDTDAIRKIYLQYSREFHPDLSADDSDGLERSSQNNQAYKILNNKDLRIRYVLECLGYVIDEKDKLSPMFLMEMMEWNERISEISNKDEFAEVEADFDGLQSDLNTRQDALTKEFDHTRNTDLLEEIKEICLKQKYLLRLKDSINTFAGL